MFDLPAAKRVRRIDLYSPTTSLEPLEPDEALIALFHSKLDHVYIPAVAEVTAKAPTKNSSEVVDHRPPAPEHNEGFEFRLFATSQTSGQAADASKSDFPTQRIILDEELAVGTRNQQGGFLIPKRDEEYYFTGAVTPERRKEFESAAVSGEDVRQLLRVRYPGLAVPWRVRYLRNGELLATADDSNMGDIATPLAAGLKPIASNEVHPSSPRKKGKPGKKRRIILRVRKRKVEDAAKRRLEEAERKKKAQAEKEEADREKRTRRNREKKVKKKMKEREKKLALGGEGLVDLDREGHSEKVGSST